MLRHLHGDGAADAAARAGDDCDLAFDDAWHAVVSARVTIQRHPRA